MISPPNSPGILLVGLGALGGRLAVQLTLASVPVMGVLAPTDRQEHKKDITYVGPTGHETTVSVPLAKSPEDVRLFNPAYALLAVKSYHTQQACVFLSQALPDAALAVTLQNGLGNLRKLQMAIGAMRAALGTCTYGASVKDGKVLWGGDGEISLGPPPGGDPSCLDGLAEILRSAGFNARISKNPQADLWRKVVVNCAINPLTAILQTTNGELLSNPWAMELAEMVIAECVTAARAAGVELDRQEMSCLVRQVMSATAPNRSSMLQDLQAGRPTEVEALSLEVDRIASATGTGAPINRTLGLLIKALEGLGKSS